MAGLTMVVLAVVVLAVAVLAKINPGSAMGPGVAEVQAPGVRVAAFAFVGAVSCGRRQEDATHRG